MTTLPTTAATRRLVDFYENLAAADVARLGDFYAPEAYFRDPFNEVRGVEAIQRIFGAMFEQLADCRFRIVDTVVDEGGALLIWDFTFRIRRFRPQVEQCIHGAQPPALRRDGSRRPPPRLLGRRRRALCQAAAARPGAAVPQAPPGLRG